MLLHKLKVMLQTVILHTLLTAGAEMTEIVKTVVKLPYVNHVVTCYEALCSSGLFTETGVKI